MFVTSAVGVVVCFFYFSGLLPVCLSGSYQDIALANERFQKNTGEKLAGEPKKDVVKLWSRKSTARRVVLVLKSQIRFVWLSQRSNI